MKKPTWSTRGSGLKAKVINSCIRSVSLRFLRRKLPESFVSAYLLTILSSSLWDGQWTRSDQPSTTSGVRSLTSPLSLANSVLYMAWMRSQRGRPVARLQIFWSISVSSWLEPNRLSTILRVPSRGSPYWAKKTFFTLKTSRKRRRPHVSKDICPFMNLRHQLVPKQAGHLLRLMNLRSVSSFFWNEAKRLCVFISKMTNSPTTKRSFRHRYKRPSLRGRKRSMFVHWPGRAGVKGKGGKGNELCQGQDSMDPHHWCRLIAWTSHRGRNKQSPPLQVLAGLRHSHSHCSGVHRANTLKSLPAKKHTETSNILH